MKAWEHFKTITHHKKLVMIGCFKLGLYKQGIFHDMSKFSPTEFWVGCKYYQGNRSPNNAEREETGYSMSWLHHKGRNKHHYEYWLDYSSAPGGGIVGQKMPIKYVAEMFVDRVAACKTYMGEHYTDRAPLDYYERGIDTLGNMIHPVTAEQLHFMLKLLADHGEKYALKYIRKNFLENPGEKDVENC